MSVRLIHPTSEFDAQNFLETCGCVRTSIPTVTRRLPVLAFLVLAAVVVSAAWWAGPTLAERKLQLDVGNLVIALGLVMAAIQWRASLEQQAMEKYEREIAAGNETADESEGIHEMMAHHYPPLSGEAKPDYARARYVYLQLDNLEYALERYMEGLASAYTTARAVMTFENRCVSPEFRLRARSQVRAASYSPIVIKTVDSVLATFNAV